MTTLPQSLLSEQQIIDIAHQCDSDASDMSQTTAFAHTLESALLAKLAEGVELEVAGSVHVQHFRGNPAMENRDCEFVAKLSPGSHELVFLSTAQAAVSAAILRERENYHKLNDETADLVARLQAEREAAVAAERAKTERALDLLDTAVTLYEDGDPCYEGLGKAFRWPGDEFQEACDLLNNERPRNASQPAPKQWPFVESPGAFTKRLREALFDLDQDLLAAVRNVLIENPPQLATISPLPAAADAGLAHELWSAAQLAPGEGVEDGVRRLAALLPAAAGVEDRAGLVDGLVEQFLANHFFGVYHCTRVWDAWNVGTMDQGDFEPAGDSGMPRELAQEAVDFILDRLASSAAQVPEGMALVPLRMNSEMQRVSREDGWQWEDLLAAAGCAEEQCIAAAEAPAQVPEGRVPGFIKPDTDEAVFFYEQDFYMLSNFSSFNLRWKGHTFPTSEHAYHWEKFEGHDDAWNAAGSIATQILRAPSAHEAYKIAEGCKPRRRPDWDDVKVGVMRDILRAKAQQHEYVRRKLLATGDRELIEDSWRDDFWGWGPNRDGQNMLGKLWMEIRAELRAAAPAAGGGEG